MTKPSSADRIAAATAAGFKRADYGTKTAPVIIYICTEAQLIAFAKVCEGRGYK